MRPGATSNASQSEYGSRSQDDVGSQTNSFKSDLSTICIMYVTYVYVPKETITIKDFVKEHNVLYASYGNRFCNIYIYIYLFLGISRLRGKGPSPELPQQRGGGRKRVEAM